HLATRRAGRLPREVPAPSARLGRRGVRPGRDRTRPAREGALVPRGRRPGGLARAGGRARGRRDHTRRRAPVRGGRSHPRAPGAARLRAERRGLLPRDRPTDRHAVEVTGPPYHRRRMRSVLRHLPLVLMTVMLAAAVTSAGVSAWRAASVQGWFPDG